MTGAGDGPTRGVRIYQTLRTAHLERSIALAPADILYREHRYDFDADLVERVRPEQVGDLRCAWLVATRGYRIVEVNEPAAIDSVRRTAAVLAAVRVSDALRRRRTRIVTYAIGNLDPNELPTPTAWWPRLGRRMDLALARQAWNRVDRVVFGTDTARQVYGAVYGIAARRRLQWTTIEALPAACDCGPAESKAPGRVLFLGDLSPRKGFDVVLTTWQKVREQLPDAVLTVVGRGALLADAEALARTDDRVRVLADPPRDVVHAELRAASVVVLPSRRRRAWREQVGLPLVEGLAHGCTVVTTDETGIADRLARTGHGVVAEELVGELLAPALVKAVEHPLDPDLVRAGLPAEDSRLAADAWLFAPTPLVVGVTVAATRPF